MFTEKVFNGSNPGFMVMGGDLLSSDCEFEF